MIYTTLIDGRKATVADFGAGLLKILFDDGEVRFARPRSKLAQFAERKIDFKAIERDLDSLDDRGRNALKAALTRSRDELIEMVKRSPNLHALAESLKALPNESELREAIRAMMTEAWKKGQASAGAESQSAKKFADDEPDEPASVTPESALDWLKQHAFWATDVLNSRAVNDAKNVIVNGIKQGKSVQDVMGDLFETFVPYLGAGVGEKVVDPFRLETIVRTNNITAYNHGRLTEMVDPEVAPFIDAIEYSAILDNRTTEVCAFLDGKCFHADDPDLEQLLPPNHFNCRSIVVPIVVGSGIEPEFITDEEKQHAKELADQRFLAESFNPLLHPRYPKGEGRGGEFSPKGATASGAEPAVAAGPKSLAELPEFFTQHGIEFVPLNTLPKEEHAVAAAMGYKLNAPPVKFDAAQSAALQELAEGVELMQQKYKLPPMRLTVADMGDEVGAATSPARRSMLFNIRLPKEINDSTVPFKRYTEMRESGATEEQARRAIARGVAYHEMGHVLAETPKYRDAFIHDIERMRDTQPHVARWFANHLSFYAGASAHEAVAESVASHEYGKRLPPELASFERSLR